MPTLTRFERCCGVAVAVTATSGCMTMKGLSETEKAFAKGDVFSGVYMGTVGLAVAGIMDVFTLGGLLNDEQVASSGAAALTSASSGQSAGAAYLTRAAGQLATVPQSADSSTPLTQQALTVEPTVSGEPSAEEQQAIARMTASPNGCPTSLAYLDERLPRYNHPDVAKIRLAVVSEQVAPVLQKMRAAGFTPADGAKKLFKNAEVMRSQLPGQEQCIRDTSLNAEWDIKRLQDGSYQFGNGTIKENCAAQYLIHYYGAIGLKEMALAAACHATRM